MIYRVRCITSWSYAEYLDGGPVRANVREETVEAETPYLAQVAGGKFGRVISCRPVDEVKIDS